MAKISKYEARLLKRTNAAEKQTKQHTMARMLKDCFLGGGSSLVH
jgi:hypothetical protein